MSLRDTILKAVDLPTVPVHVPEWNCTVYVRSFTARERDAWEASTFVDGKVNYDNLRARLVVLATVDEHGKRIFQDEDAEALGQKSAKVVDRIAEQINKLNALSAKDIEELSKN